MEKNNTNTSGQASQDEPVSPGIQHEKIGAQEIGQNKYPKFDMGGDNYASNPVIPLADNIASIQTPPVTTLVEGTVTPSVNANTNAVTYASLTSRSYASFIDSIIVGAISLIITLPEYAALIKTMIASFNSDNPGQIDPSTISTTNPLYTMLSVISVIFGLIYPVYFIGKKGATPGKKLMKIKVIDKETGQPPGMLKAFLREIVGKFVSSVFLFLGYLWAVWDKDKQAWHDKIAGTVVVNVRQ